MINMFGTIKKWIEDKKQSYIVQKAITCLLKKPGFLAAKALLEYQLFEAPHGLSKTFDLETRKKIQSEILEDMISIYLNENPVLSNRSRLVESVLEMATYGVLILNSEEDLNDFCLNPAISGELRFYLDEISLKDDGIKDSLQAYLPEDRDLHSIFLVRHWRGHLLAEIYRLIRLDVEGKIDPSKDWYKPFIFAMYITKEDEFRELLGLNSLLKQHSGELGRLQHECFVNILLSDDENPLLTYENLFN